MKVEKKKTTSGGNVLPSSKLTVKNAIIPFELL